MLVELAGADVDVEYTVGEEVDVGRIGVSTPESKGFLIKDSCASVGDERKTE